MERKFRPAFEKKAGWRWRGERVGEWSLNEKICFYITNVSFFL